MRKLLTSLTFAACWVVPALQADINDVARGQASQHYPEVVHAAYADALGGVQYLHDKLTQFVASPDAAGLEACRKAWTKARQPYLATEAFRFYGGPIDDEQGREGLINAWPVDESWLEKGEGSETKGIIEDSENYPSITAEVLKAANQKDGEKNVACGWHAIEFLLWGRDESVSGPGDRPLSDFTTSPHAQRRRDALQALSEMLVNSLSELVAEWEPSESGENYRTRFLAQPSAESVRQMLTGLIFLSGQEMAGERLNVALDTRDQEDEQCCFSDTTSQDPRWDLAGINAVWEGTYESLFVAENDVSGPGLKVACLPLDAAMTESITAALERCRVLAVALPHPFDQAIAAEDASHGRRMYQEMRAALENLSTLLQAMADKMNLQIANGAAFYSG